MYEMLVQQNNPVTPLTPVSTPPGPRHSDLSPRSSNSSFVSSSDLNSSSLHSPNKDRSPQEFSALQHLQFALQSNALFSTLINESQNGNQPGRLVKPCESSSSSSLPSSPDDERKNHSEDNDNNTSLLNGMKTHTPASSPDDSTNATNIIFQCPLCSVVCNSRHEFNEHLVTHSQQYACRKCPFLSEDEDSLREHVQEAHDVSDFEVLTDDEVRTPKTNSQGKMKIFKCKQCGYTAVTKSDFWEHTKSHIRHEKMLTCPKCPFVTEYKHHLEYHLRNHFGSKPFQCNKCAYSCVNKSMLNSHLKSHSNIYQYRCADCSYATKYCHSLKLHLRKYDHKPSMVLNPDGTPNPLPIIDVYGTRRGPKIKRQDHEGFGSSPQQTSPSAMTKDKPSRKHSKSQNLLLISDMEPEIPKNNASTPPVSPKFNAQEIKQEFGCGGGGRNNNNNSPPNRNNLQVVDEIRSHNNVAQDLRGNIHLQQHQQVRHAVPLQMNSINPAALQGLIFQTAMRQDSINPALQGLFLQNAVNNNPVLEFVGKSPMELYAAALNQYIITNPAQIQIASPLDLVKSGEEQRTKVVVVSQNHQQSPNNAEMPRKTTKVDEMNNNNNSHAPLDLRNPKSNEDNRSNHSNEETNKKRKRKGKALKYDRTKDFKGNMNSEDSNEVLDFSNNNNNNQHYGNNYTIEHTSVAKEVKSNESCKYCGISFPPLLYDMHMKFHSSDSEPFKCKHCGIQCADKVAFFVHLNEASHFK